MTTLLQISINISALNSSLDYRSKKWISGLRLSKPINYPPVSRSNIGSLHQRRFKLGVSRERWSFLDVGRGEDGILMREEGWKRKKRVVVAKFNQGLGGGGGGGGGGRGNNARVLGNLALAIGLTYLSMTGQLGWLFDAIGWVLDAIVSLWLLAVVLPLVGLGTFLWWAAQDMVQDSCPNCGNEFQIFKFAVNDTLQLCPYCSQPFSVVGNEFVSDPVNFSNESTSSGKGFKNFSARSNKKEKNFSTAVVDVEAEVEDID